MLPIFYQLFASGRVGLMGVSAEIYLRNKLFRLWYV